MFVILAWYTRLIQIGRQQSECAAEPRCSSQPAKEWSSAGIWDPGTAFGRANIILIARQRKRSSAKSWKAIAASTTDYRERYLFTERRDSPRMSGRDSKRARKAFSS